jgi:hypothetical protein
MRGTSSKVGSVCRLYTSNASPRRGDRNEDKARSQLVVAILDAAYAYTLVIVPAHDLRLLRRWLEWLAARCVCSGKPVVRRNRLGYCRLENNNNIDARAI